MNKRPTDIGTLALFISAGTVIAASCLYLYLYSRTSSLVDQAILAKDIVAAEETDKTQGNGIISMYQATAAERANLQGYFVQESDAVAFINAVEEVGNESGATVSISSINADNSVGSSTGVVGSITASITAGGSWAEVMRSLALFEALPYGISIKRASLSVSGAPSATNASSASSASPAAYAESKPQWSLFLDIKAAVLNAASSTPS